MMRPEYLWIERLNYNMYNESHVHNPSLTKIKPIRTTLQPQIPLKTHGWCIFKCVI